MATAKRLTKAGVKLVDPAVKDAYHDEVLNWAIDNLATLIKDRFSLDAEAVESGLTKAKEKFNSYLTHDVEILIANALKNNGVHGWEGFIDFDAATQGEFKSAQESLSLIRKHVSQFCLLESAGRAKVASIEVMKRVAYLETKSAIHKAYGAYIKECVCQRHLITLSISTWTLTSVHHGQARQRHGQARQRREQAAPC